MDSISSFACSRTFFFIPNLLETNLKVLKAVQMCLHSFIHHSFIIDDRLTLLGANGYQASVIRKTLDNLKFVEYIKEHRPIGYTGDTPHVFQVTVKQ